MNEIEQGYAMTTTVIEKKTLDTIIWEILSKTIPPNYNRESVIEKRKQEIRERTKSWTRDQYRKSLNDLVKKSFYNLVDKTWTKKDITLLKSVEFGTKQWSDDSYNIRRTGSLCPNGCPYCFILPIMHKNFEGTVDITPFYEELVAIIESEAASFKRLLFSPREIRQVHMKRLELDWEKVMKSWSKNSEKKLFMFPTSHDIFPDIVGAFIVTCLKMLDAGHSILVTTKPRMSCVRIMCDAFESYKDGAYKDKITYRFTITTNDQGVKDKWEWFAPTYKEGLACLKHAFDRGFKTSVSMEPFLTDPIPTVKELLPYVNDEIWIGMMNGFPSEKVLGIKLPRFLTDDTERLRKNEYTFENVDRIVGELRNIPNVQWKESIIKMYLKERGK